MPQIAFQARVRGRSGAYDVQVIQEADDPAIDALTLDLAASPRLRWSRLDVGYGIEVLASYTELEFVDPRRAVAEFFASTFEEADYRVRITGDGFTWNGRVQRVGRRRPISGRVHPVGVTTLRAYDRLGGLANVLGSGTMERPLGELVAEALFEAVSFDGMAIRWYLDAWPANVHAEDVRLLRFTEEMFDGRGDYGTMLAQTNQAAVNFGLRIFQNPAVLGHFFVVHRPSVGEGRTDAQRTRPTDTWDTLTYAADVLEIADADHQADTVDTVDRIPRLGRIVLEGDGEMDLVIDGGFASWQSNFDATFWEGVAYERSTDVPGPGPAASAELLGAGLTPTIFQDLLSVSLEANVRLRVAYDQKALHATNSEISLEIRLRSGGTDYFVQADGSWDTVQYEEDATPNLNIWESEMFESLADFPAAGQLRITFRGAETRLTNVRAIFVDETGQPITEWTFAIGDGSGDVIRMKQADPMEADEDGAGDWNPAGVWTSARYSQTFNSLSEYMVTDRLFQQSEDLRALDTTLYGVHGPGRRILFDVDGDGHTEHFIPTGLEIDLEPETTRGVWIEIPRDVALAGGES